MVIGDPAPPSLPLQVGRVQFTPVPRAPPARDGEVIDRLRRLETRMVKLCHHLGFDPVTYETTFVFDEASRTLEVTGLDATLSALLHYCARSGINGSVGIKFKGVSVGVINAGQ